MPPSGLHLAMDAHLLNFADLLRRQPDLFHFVLPSLRLVENNKYLGAYYDLITTGGVIVECHSTIGHWRSPAVSDLNARQTENLMNRLETVFQMDWQFADGPLVLLPRRLGHRVLLTMHVRGLVGQRW